MIKERSLSFGKIYHRETNVPESSTFHQTNNFFLQNVIWKQQSYARDTHSSRNLKSVLSQILIQKQHNSP